MHSPLDYFTDPVLRAPTIGCMLMCVVASLVGVLAYLRRQSLLGEALSHAAYPGVVIGVLVAALFSVTEQQAAPFILVGAACGALGGLLVIHVMTTRLKVRADTALCFVLASFFGVGLTLASRIQVTQTELYRKIQAYLYGQAATMTDYHIVIYGLFALVVSILVFLLYKELQVVSFDRGYARSLGVHAGTVEVLLFGLIVLSVTVGIRSVGVVLMSAMLIAPAVAARQYTNRLSTMFILAALIGMASGFMGNYLSVELSIQANGKPIGLPTGPMIVLTATAICVFSLVFAPERGLLVRGIRVLRFRRRCLYENILKSLWRLGPHGTYSLEQIGKSQPVHPRFLRAACHRLEADGWMEHDAQGYRLSPEGIRRAAHIVRLHRLWELYLADAMGMGVKRVHMSAEEMEHVITPDLEAQLTEFLNDPVLDPHHQPIPPAEPPL